MTVGELIQALSNLHPDLTVIMDGFDAPEYYGVDKVVLDNGKVYLTEVGDSVLAGFQAITKDGDSE